MINKYPYTDFSELNLDWFLTQFKTLYEEWLKMKENNAAMVIKYDNMVLEFGNLTETVNTFTAFVTNYFDNLDVQQEINNKLDDMVQQGTLQPLLAPYVAAGLPDVVTDQLPGVVTLQLPDEVQTQLPGVVADQIDAAVAPEVPGAVSDWLTANVDPVGSAVVVDSSLSISGAAADAKVTGDEIASLEADSTLWGKVYRPDIVTDLLSAPFVTIVDESFADPSTGLISTNTSYEIAEIFVSDLHKVFLWYTLATIMSYAPVAYYDINDTYISGQSVTFASDDDKDEYDGHKGLFYTIPSNAYKARFDLYKSRLIRTRFWDVDQDPNPIEVTIPLYKKNVNPLYGKMIVNFGDSIFGNFRDTNDTTDKSISKMIADATGATVYNAGFGGCRMALHSVPWNNFSMYKLADSIASGDWTAQTDAIANNPGTFPTYFSETVTMLQGLDFSKVDYITIGYGVNDFMGNVFIKSTDASFSHEYDYFEGALRYSIRTILNAYPNLKIIVITPCWKWYPDANGAYSYCTDDPQAENTRHYTLPDYVKAIIKVCEEYHVPYIDTYYTLGFNPYSYTAYFTVKGIDGATVSDGTHPKQNGRQLRADRIVGQLCSLY